MNKKIKSYKEICKISRELQKEGKVVVFCHGFFDILHRGHIHLLAESKKHGDVLIVGIDHDDNARILKGPNRPINDEKFRMFIVSNLNSVDYVFLMPSLSGIDVDDYFRFYGEIFKKLKPNVVTTCLEAGKHGEYKKRDAEMINAKFVNIKRKYEDSTSKILKKLISRK